MLNQILVRKSHFERLGVLLLEEPVYYMPTPHSRCRLIISASLADHSLQSICDALEGGDIACLLLDQGENDDKDTQKICEKIVESAHQHDVAVLFSNDTPLVGRAKADGLLVSPNVDTVRDAIARFSPHKMIGCVNIRERHRAMEIGELDPDFVMFGKPDGDIKPNAHPKNLALGDWWSKLFEIPCAVMGGTQMDSVVEVALCGAEFVVLREAVFKGNAKENVRRANQHLDEYAPILDSE